MGTPHLYHISAMRTVTRVAALVACATSALACASDEIGGPGSDRLELRASSTELQAGQTAQLQVLLDGSPVDARDVQWSTRDRKSVV